MTSRNVITPTHPPCFLRRGLFRSHLLSGSDVAVSAALPGSVGAAPRCRAPRSGSTWCSSCWRSACSPGRARAWSGCWGHRGTTCTRWRRRRARGSWPACRRASGATSGSREAISCWWIPSRRAPRSKPKFPWCCSRPTCARCSARGSGPRLSRPWRGKTARGTAPGISLSTPTGGGPLGTPRTAMGTRGTAMGTAMGTARTTRRTPRTPGTPMGTATGTVVTTMVAPGTAMVTLGTMMVTLVTTMVTPVVALGTPRTMMVTPMVALGTMVVALVTPGSVMVTPRTAMVALVTAMVALVTRAVAASATQGTQRPPRTGGTAGTGDTGTAPNKGTGGTGDPGGVALCHLPPPR